MKYPGVCESCFEEGECCCGQHCYTLIDTLYYSATPTNEFIVASDENLGSQISQAFVQTKDDGQVLADPGTIFAESSWLKLSPDSSAVKAQTIWTFTGQGRRRRGSFIAAQGSYFRSSTNKNVDTTFIVTGGLGRYKYAKKIQLTCTEATGLCVAKIYA